MLLRGLGKRISHRPEVVNDLFCGEGERRLQSIASACSRLWLIAMYGLDRDVIGIEAQQNNTLGCCN